MRANVVTEKLIAKCACTDFNIGVVSVAPMSGPPLHVNTREDEWFHVLDGEITFQVGQERLVAGPGASIFAWRGVPHGFQNLTADTATVLQMVTPEDLENRLFITEKGKELHVSALRHGWFSLPLFSSLYADWPGTVTSRKQVSAFGQDRSSLRAEEKRPKLFRFLDLGGRSDNRNRLLDRMVKMRIDL